MKYQILLAAVLLFFGFGTLQAQSPPPVEINEYHVAIENGKAYLVSGAANGKAVFSFNGKEKELIFANGKASIDLKVDERGKLLLVENKKTGHRLYHLSATKNGGSRIRRIPFWLSVLPPLMAIALALIFKEVIVSLFVGVWTGAFIAGGLRIDSFYYFFDSLFSVVEKYLINALADTGHLSVIVFSLLIGGMVAVISRNGGMAGVVKSLSRYAKSPRSSQFITWFLGVAIFFDDYANTLIVGNTMRSVTDRFKVSREKLAYIVDSTAAPVSAVAFITTWIGAELGYIDEGLKLLHGFDMEVTPYAIFLSSLKYSFYPALTLAFILMLIYFKKDFGPMYKAEVRARKTGKTAPPKVSDMEQDDENLDPVPGAPLKWYNAAIPVFVVIFVTLFGLIDTGMTSLASKIAEANIPLASDSWGAIWGGINALNGEDASFFFNLGELIGSADSYVALLWASFAGVAVAIAMTLSGRIMRLEQAVSTMTTGFKAMLPAIIILTLAWSLASTTEQLHTAVYLSTAMEGSINPYLMPVIVFVLAAFISFSTGSSWSTMAILYPIAIPTSWAVSHGAGLAPEISFELMLNVISVTLGASVLGDHCSPISDTTILSSLASDCNHIDHVRTQMPYALLVGAMSLVLCLLSTLLGGGWFICFVLLVLGLAGLAGLVIWFGKKVPA
ncbi:MAG TPA: Na+/H+ antiporter NhaC family protein [Bacteroidetes bacterium]|nr:Na+/H+ antiporter NhaC family protein [Bacteroidota bacterium]